MDAFEFQDQSQPSRSVSSIVWNVLTVLVLLMVLCVVAGFLMIFLNPNSQLNIFPPPTLPAAAEMPTATPTARLVLPPTWTASPTEEPTMTNTPNPTSSPMPSETPFSLFTLTPTTAGNVGGMPFIVSPGTPVGTSSLSFYPEAECNWLGVAGQVFDLSGSPVSGQQVRIGGILAGRPIDQLMLTGLATAYGAEGFYEFVLGDKPIASIGTLWVQLLDQGGLPMSDKIFFDTFGECENNLIFINFKQVR